MDFNKSETRKNLAKSFAAECQAGARYQFMAKRAEADKLFYIKDTMKMLAKNEMAHAKLFYDYIVEHSKEDVVEFDADYSYLESKLNISFSKEAKVERDEFEKIYPTFAEIARNEGFEDIAKSFELVAKVEYSHALLLDKLAGLYKNGNLYKGKAMRVFRCTNCGHIEKLTEGWKTCPLCSLEQGYIMIDYANVFDEASEI